MIWSSTLIEPDVVESPDMKTCVDELKQKEMVLVTSHVFPTDELWAVNAGRLVGVQGEGVGDGADDETGH